jgi:hypothetical protein
MRYLKGYMRCWGDQEALNGNDLVFYRHSYPWRQKRNFNFMAVRNTGTVTEPEPEGCSNRSRLTRREHKEVLRRIYAVLTRPRNLERGWPCVLPTLTEPDTRIFIINPSGALALLRDTPDDDLRWNSRELLVHFTSGPQLRFPYEIYTLLEVFRLAMW